MKLTLKTVLLATVFVVSATSAMAGPILTFSVSEGVQPADVGTITVTQAGADSVTIGVDLDPGYGFLNTGGPHTPFAFNVEDATDLSIAWTQPVNGTYASGVFLLNESGGDATPFGTFGIAIDSTADNGSGAAYYGDLIFTLTDSDGSLDTTDFIANLDGWFFAAELTDGENNTGSQAWKEFVEGGGGPGPGNEVPEPGTLAVVGAGLAGWWALRRRRQTKA
jgi:hypothetical protein